MTSVPDFSQRRAYARSVVLREGDPRVAVRGEAGTRPAAELGRVLRSLDPGLPVEFLPQRWLGFRAADLFLDLKGRLEGPAQEFVRETLKA